MARGTVTRAANEGRAGRGATTDERRFAEELGSYWEDAGGTRMAGRVLGALLLADPPEMSSGDLVRFLRISAGSVSTATRELVRPRVAERVRIPGDRQDYFRATLTGDALIQFLRNRIELTRRWPALMEQGRRLVQSKDPAVAERLEEIEEFWRFIEAESRAALDRWEQHQRERRAPP